ncbi:hypothetical protein OEZ86_011273 [Tetradesmus obliquus]|nr:hypothetical protein OEZ86_011273 [Tetradesmus obliquus]
MSTNKTFDEQCQGGRFVPAGTAACPFNKRHSGIGTFQCCIHPKGDCQKYTVERGDTLVQLAKVYNTTIGLILQKNPGISNRNLIREGQALLICPWGQEQSPGATHCVFTGWSNK